MAFPRGHHHGSLEWLTNPCSLQPGPMGMRPWPASSATAAIGLSSRSAASQTPCSLEEGAPPSLRGPQAMLAVLPRLPTHCQHWVNCQHFTTGEVNQRGDRQPSANVEAPARRPCKGLSLVYRLPLETATPSRSGCANTQGCQRPQSQTSSQKGGTFLLLVILLLSLLS